MYCTKCGSQVPEGNQFCVACGTALGASGPAGQTAPSPSQAVPATPPANLTPPAPPKRRRGRALVISLVTIIATLALAAGVGYWLWSAPSTVDPGSVETVVVSPAE